MSNNDENRNLPKPSAGLPTQIHLNPSTSVDLSWLPEHERKALLVDYAKGMIDLGMKAQELHIDAAILKKTLDDLSSTTREIADTGNAVTITHTQTTKVGTTQVIMGNTAQAQSGKLTKSQTGEMDWTPYYVFGVIIALVIIFALLRH